MYDMQAMASNKNTTHAYSACTFCCTSSSVCFNLNVIAVRIALAMCIFVISVVVVLSISMVSLVIMISIINLIVCIIQFTRDKKHVWIPSMLAG